MRPETQLTEDAQTGDRSDGGRDGSERNRDGDRERNRDRGSEDKSLVAASFANGKADVTLSEVWLPRKHSLSQSRSQKSLLL